MPIMGLAYAVGVFNNQSKMNDEIHTNKLAEHNKKIEKIIEDNNEQEKKYIETITEMTTHLKYITEWVSKQEKRGL